MRLLKYNGAAFAMALTFWSLIVVVEVKVQPYGFLKYLSFLSLPGVVFLHGWANWMAFSTIPDEGTRTVRSIVATLIMAPISILFGVVAAISLKFLMGGHI
ncbi:MAG TPA: hypothetical protein VMB21_07095 [Candidatus Limnocylindria bacterium]|nr:hypothetical protein [Candidatus Limnocylindria bacterium]